MSGPIRYRLAVPTDRDRLIDLFRAVYGEDYGRRTQAWRYLDRPWGRALVAVAEADGRLVGAQPSHEVPLMIDGAPARGALLLDVMTHPAYRRRGVFTGVVEMLRRAGHAEGMRILLTTPNRAAAAGFSRLAAWTRLGELAPLVCPIDAAALAGGHSPALRALLRPLAWLGAGRRPAAAAAAAADDGEGPGDAGSIDRPIAPLWPEFARTIPCMIARDPAFLAWRFSEENRREYRCLIAGDGPRCEALAVVAPGELMGRDVLLLVEMMALPEAAAAVDVLTRRIVRRAAATGAAAVVGYLPHRSALVGMLCRRGFYLVPRLLRPRPYAVWAATDLEGARRDRALDLGAWHMTLTDSDLA